MSVKIYKVGGCVRDSILGVKSKDIDYAVEASSYDAMKQHIIDNGGTIFLEKPEFLTIRAKFRKVDADFVLCRKEASYSDGRRPDSVQPGTILDDLARRDFTMNAIAEDENGKKLDPFDGEYDIFIKRIKCVGNPEDRFLEDSLRILRAIRFSITKEFVLAKSIQECFKKPEIVERLDNVSEERIREELYKCFKHDTAMTLTVLHMYPLIFESIFKSRRLWLKPTFEE